MNKIFMLLILSICVFVSCSSAQHFNNLAENEDKESADVIPYLEIKKGDSVADLGAGGGYFSFKLAKTIGDAGKIFSVDIDPKNISFISKNADEKGIKNIEPVLAEYNDSKLKSGSVDLVFIRNAYHDFQDRVQYFTQLKSVFKPGGRIVIIDYDPSKLNFLRKLFGHYLDEKTIAEEMKQAGYMKKKSYSILKHQSFNIFVLDDSKN